MLLFLSTSGASAQPIYHHNNFWGRVALSDKIADKWKWEFFLQSRTQNDTASKLDIFKHHQLSSYWLWLHYQAGKDLRISASPFCYFNSISLFPQPTELGNRGVKEFRWALQAEHTHRFKPVNFLNRLSLEYRLRDLSAPDVYTHNYRIRYRARLERPIKKEWLQGKQLSLILYDEVFFEFGEAVKTSPRAFNQNRLYAGFSYEVVRNVKFNLGYMYLYQQRPTGALDHSNVLWAIVTFDNLFSQFRRKAPCDIVITSFELLASCFESDLNSRLEAHSYSLTGNCLILFPVAA